MWLIRYSGLKGGVVAQNLILRAVFLWRSAARSCSEAYESFAREELIDICFRSEAALPIS